MAEIFTEISIIVFIAIIVSLIMKTLKQPLLIGHIITGILVGPYFFNVLGYVDIMHTLAEIGIAILLFMVGIHLNPNIIRDVGKISLVTGLGQVIFTSAIGFIILFLLGFAFTESVYVAIALTFSSTIIIMKLLSDKGDLNALYGKISMGFLIVQDLVAMVLLMIISATAVASGYALLQNVLIGIVIIILYLIFGYYALPSITKKIADSHEFLLLFAIAWCLAAASLFAFFDFSIEVGALLAGITLSMSPYRKQIGSILMPIRDFFILMFFILLGSQMIFSNISQYLIPIIILSLFVLVGNVLIVLILMTRLKYTSRTGFLAGLTVAQISEFSLILVGLGFSVGDLSQEILSFVTVIGLITIAGSTYMILYGDKIYSKLAPYLKKLEREDIIENTKLKDRKTDIFLFGGHRTGAYIIEHFLSKKKNFLVVDHDPETVNRLTKVNIPVMYGDAQDLTFLSELDIKQAKLIISTIPNHEINMFLLDTIKKLDKTTIFIGTARKAEDSVQLYDAGADFVITPHYLGSSYVSNLVSENKFDALKYEKEKEKHLKSMLHRINIAPDK